MSYQCPVCGYDELTKPPEDYTICPSCGTEFGNDDFDQSHRELRHEWISNNMPWFSRSTSTPKNWSPFRQLIIAEHSDDLIAHPRFRDELDFRSEINKAFSEVFISKQLKALRERKEQPLTQTQLASKAGMKQSRISELEGMNYSSWSINTLERLAKALGVAFTYSFEAWRDLVFRVQQGLSNEVLAIPSFEHDHIAVTAQAFPIETTAPSSSSLWHNVQHRVRRWDSDWDVDIEHLILKEFFTNDDPSNPATYVATMTPIIKKSVDAPTVTESIN